VNRYFVILRERIAVVSMSVFDGHFRGELWNITCEDKQHFYGLDLDVLPAVTKTPV